MFPLNFNRISAYFVFPVLIVLFSILYVRMEQPLYYFDYGFYWRLFGTFNAHIAEGDWVKAALTAIKNDDYSPSPIIPLYPLYAIFGASREVYIAGIAAFYLFPTAVIAALLSRWLGTRATIVPLFLAILYTPFWVPTLRGLPDIVGCIFLGLASWLIFASDFLRRRAFVVSILLGIIIWIPFLFRRWYAYSILSFFITSYALGLLHTWKIDRTKGILRLTGSMFLAGSVSILLIYIFQKNLAIRAITTDYSTLYDAYQVSFLTHVSLFYSRTGLFIISMIVIGAIFVAPENRTKMAFFFITPTLTIVIFSTTQFLGPQHYLPVAFWYFPIYAFAFCKLMRSSLFKKIVSLKALIFLFPIAIFATGVTGITDRNVLADSVLGQYSFAPLHIENFDQYERLTADIERLAQKGKRVAVFASSEQLSYSLLTAINPAIAPAVLETPQRDRDGVVMLSALSADFAVWSTPNQTHLAPGSQTIVTLPNEMLREGRGFGAAFGEVVQEYTLAGGMKAVLAKRTRPITIAEMEGFLAELFAARPDMKSLVQNSMGVSFDNRTDALGDVYGTVSVVDGKTLYMHPGANSPTSTVIPFIGQRPVGVDLSISAAALETCPEADGVEVTMRVDEIAPQKAIVLPGGSPIIMAVPDGAKRVELAVQKRATPLCDSLTATFRF
jgi:hypothetical protein